MTGAIRSLPLAEVRAELSQKTREQIEAETADRWAARAIVSYERYAAARARGSSDEALAWVMVGIEYEHEAIEHAGQAGTGNEIRRAIDEAKQQLGVPSPATWHPWFAY